MLTLLPPSNGASAGQELSLRDIASRLVISKGKKKGQHPSPATALRLLREHDDVTAVVSASA